ncbi:MAG: hypothetical protein IIA59_07735 [Candidatus Marinimicrobia bacterium]|nr:hypothetical protein [Candidatus Neomarinimicrobiota bacterium]
METLDVDRLFSKASKAEKTENYDILKNSADHLIKAADHWDIAHNACSTVASMVSNTAEGLLLQEDIGIFQTLAKGARSIAAEMQKGILPPNRPVHRLTSLMRDQDVMAERRARAYQGLSGHLPKDYI